MRSTLFRANTQDQNEKTLFWSVLVPFEPLGSRFVHCRHVDCVFRVSLKNGSIWPGIDIERDSSSVFFVCMYIQFFKKLYVRRSEEKVHTYNFLEILTKIMLESALRKKKISKVYLKVSKFSACGGQSTFTMNTFIDLGYRGPKWCNILKISQKLYVRQKPNKKHCFRPSWQKKVRRQQPSTSWQNSKQGTCIGDTDSSKNTAMSFSTDAFN